MYNDPDRHENPPRGDSSADMPPEKPFYRCWWFWPCILLIIGGTFAIYHAFTLIFSPAAPSSPSSSSVSAPAAEAEPYVAPDPITYSGYGDDYFDISPFDDLYYFKISGNSESRHFAVTGYDAFGNYTELFVNTTDPYSGYVLDPGKTPESSRSTVRATGPSVFSRWLPHPLCPLAIHTAAMATAFLSSLLALHPPKSTATATLGISPLRHTVMSMICWLTLHPFTTAPFASTQAL